MKRRCLSRPIKTNTHITSFSNDAPSRLTISSSASEKLTELHPEDPFEELRHLHSKILIEMKAQLPSLTCDEVFGLAWEVTKQLYKWVGEAWHISHLNFRRTHLQDPVSSGWLTILDFLCNASSVTTGESASDGGAHLTRPKICKGTVVMGQQSGEHFARALYTTDLSKAGQRHQSAAYQEFNYLKERMTKRGARPSHVPDRLLQTLRFAHCAGEWRDPAGAQAAERTLEAVVTTEFNRVCAWGVVNQTADRQLFCCYVEGFQYTPPPRNRIGREVKYSSEEFRHKVGVPLPLENGIHHPLNGLDSKKSAKDLSLELLQIIQAHIPVSGVGEIEFGITNDILVRSLLSYRFQTRATVGSEIVQPRSGASTKNPSSRGRATATEYTRLLEDDRLN